MEFWFEFEGKYHFFIDSFETVVEADDYFQAVCKLTADLDGYLATEASSF